MQGPFLFEKVPFDRHLPSVLVRGPWEGVMALTDRVDEVNVYRWLVELVVATLQWFAHGRLSTPPNTHTIHGSPTCEPWRLKPYTEIPTEPNQVELAHATNCPSLAAWPKGPHQLHHLGTVSTYRFVPEYCFILKVSCLFHCGKNFKLEEVSVVCKTGLRSVLGRSFVCKILKGHGEHPTQVRSSNRLQVTLERSSRKPHIYSLQANEWNRLFASYPPDSRIKVSWWRKGGGSTNFALILTPFRVRMEGGIRGMFSIALLAATPRDQRF